MSGFSTCSTVTTSLDHYLTIVAQIRGLTSFELTLLAIHHGYDCVGIAERQDVAIVNATVLVRAVLDVTIIFFVRDVMLHSLTHLV